MIIIEGINYIGISVSSLDDSIKFYRDLFDFDVIDKFSTSGTAFMKVADMVLGLYEVKGFKNDPASKNRISFFVDEEDFEDALVELENNKIEITYGPENLRGGKTVVFLDPDGNQIELAYPVLG